MKSSQIKKELKKHIKKEKAPLLAKFFKTGKGEYGEGDKFLGIMVPDQRKVAKQFKEIPLKELEKLIKSVYHEERLTSLLILTYKFEKADEKLRNEIYRFYLKYTKYINNWDLIDLSAPKIVGKQLENKDRSILYKLAKSKSLWEKRISILATFTFIKNKDFKDALKIAEILVNDNHDLIHKAVGWMLREIGNIDQKTEETFLKKYYKTMPRTMLRYAIEKFDKKKRKFYMGK